MDKNAVVKVYVAHVKLQKYVLVYDINFLNNWNKKKVVAMWVQSSFSIDGKGKRVDLGVSWAQW